MEKTRINVSCGQTDFYPKCLEAMGRQLGTPIYYPPYWEEEVAALEMLHKLMNTENDIILMDGSATYGEEAAMMSTLEDGDKILTVITGTFGQVLYDLAKVVGANPIEVKVPEGKAVKPEEIKAKLLEDREIKMVAVVHVETSQGTFNPVDKIGLMLKEEFPDVLYMVDAVSSLGAMEVRVDDWGIDICCSSPQKCLNAPQGTAIVSVSERAWNEMYNRPTPIKSLCLDLTVWRPYHVGVKNAYEASIGGGGVRDISFATARKAAHGPSPSYVLIKGLRASLEEIFEEGLENVYRRHRIAARAVREGIRAMGLGVVAGEECAAPVCTRIIWPQGLDTGQLAKLMQTKYGVALGGERIGNMGFIAKPQYILPTLLALEMALSEMGVNVPQGAGVIRASAVFSQGE